MRGPPADPSSSFRLQAVAEESVLVGREAELAAITTALGRTRPGAPRAVVLGGEPGMGKTRLAAEAAQHAARGGARVLYGRCEDGGEFSYQPFAEIVADLGVDLGTTGGSTATPTPSILFSAVREALTEASAAAPLLIVLDDVHWADAPTLRLVGHLLSAARAPHALVLLCQRSVDPPPSGALADALTEPDRRGRVDRVALSGLTDEEVGRVVGAWAGGADAPAAAQFVTALRRDTGGNPFLITELLREHDPSAVAGDWARAALELPHALPPATLHGLARRLGGLGTDAGVLEVAAVIGDEVDVDLLARASGIGAPVLAGVLERACDAALLRAAPDGYAFAHALVRRALLQAAGPARLGMLHRQVAEALDAISERAPDARIVERAVHWRQAAPADPGRALDCAARAGWHALGQRDPSAGVRWFTRALELHAASSTDESLRCELLVGLGTTQRFAGQYAYRQSLLDAAHLALALGDVPRLVRAALANWRDYVSATGTVDVERVAMIEAALELVDPGDSAERALLEARWAAEHYYTHAVRERRIELADAALARARRIGDPAVLTEVLTARIGIWEPESLDIVLRDTGENVALADRLGDPLRQAQALRWRAGALIEAGQVADAEAELTRLEEIAERLGDGETRWAATHDQATLAILHGRLEDAERLAVEAFAQATANEQPDALSFHANHLCAIRWEQGRLGELQAVIAQVVIASPGMPSSRAFLALAYVEAGLRDEAGRVLDGDFASDFEEFGLNITWTTALLCYAHVAHELAHTGAAAALYRRLEPWTGRIAWNTGVWGSVDLALARLARTLGHAADAERHADEARRLAEHWGARGYRARALVDRGAWLLEDERRDEAVVLLEAAARDAEAAGADGIARRAQALLGGARAQLALASSPGGARLAMRARAPAPPSAAPEQPEARLHIDGRLWLVGLGTRVHHLEDAKGLRYLAHVVGIPGVEHHVLDLQSGGLAVPAPGDAGPVLDQAARSAYRERLVDVEQELEEAERFNDPERADHAREERDAIARELAKAIGLNGRDRRAADPAERARLNVTRALRRAIGRIEGVEPDLGHHLRLTVRTGVFCLYDPPPRDRLTWKLSA